MSKSRREFLAETSLGLLAATAPLAVAAPRLSQEQQPGLPPGAPPAFGTAHPMGPVSYTHLDVYKRQIHKPARNSAIRFSGR